MIMKNILPNENPNPEIKPLPREVPVSIPPEIVPEKEEGKPYVSIPEIPPATEIEIKPGQY